MIDSVYLPVQLGLRTRSVGMECQVELYINDQSWATLLVDTTLTTVAQYRGLQALGEALGELFIRAGRLERS